MGKNAGITVSEPQCFGGRVIESWVHLMLMQTKYPPLLLLLLLYGCMSPTPIFYFLTLKSNNVY